jgi:hypothetical protein
MTAGKQFDRIQSIANATEEDLIEVLKGAKRNKFKHVTVVTDRYSRTYPISDLPYLTGMTATLNFKE